MIMKVLVGLMPLAMGDCPTPKETGTNWLTVFHAQDTRHWMQPWHEPMADGVHKVVQALDEYATYAPEWYQWAPISRMSDAQDPPSGPERQMCVTGRGDPGEKFKHLVRVGNFHMRTKGESVQNCFDDLPDATGEYVWNYHRRFESEMNNMKYESGTDASQPVTGIEALAQAAEKTRMNQFGHNLMILNTESRYGVPGDRPDADQWVNRSPSFKPEGDRGVCWYPFDFIDTEQMFMSWAAYLVPRLTYVYIVLPEGASSDVTGPWQALVHEIEDQGYNAVMFQVPKDGSVIAEKITDHFFDSICGSGNRPVPFDVSYRCEEDFIFEQARTYTTTIQPFTFTKGNPLSTVTAQPVGIDVCDSTDEFNRCSQKTCCTELCGAVDRPCPAYVSEALGHDCLSGFAIENEDYVPTHYRSVGTHKRAGVDVLLGAKWGVASSGVGGDHDMSDCSSPPPTIEVQYRPL